MGDTAPTATDGARRRFLSLAAMSAGLVAGYGALAAIAGRFLYPARPPVQRWMYVVQADRVAAGESLLYRAPTGETINITRKETSGAASDFVALSSVCPHLGCQVHWEAQNDRYFCPCHNGVFDPDGVGTSGPPGDAGQSLSRYEVDVQNGLLYIRVATERLARAERGAVIARVASRPGHDPCLAPPATVDRSRRT